MDVTARKQAEASAARKAGRAGARRTRGHPRRAHRNPYARIEQPLAAILPTPPPESTSSTHLNPTFGGAQHASDICADTERAAEVIRGLRAMLKRDTPGFTSLDLNQLIRDVDRIVHGDAICTRSPSNSTCGPASARSRATTFNSSR